MAPRTVRRTTRQPPSGRGHGATELAERLTELEIKFCHQDDTLEKLSAVLIAQQAQIVRLERRLAELEARRWEPEADEAGPPDEKPPHY